jgi:hypothetical protein
MGAKLGLSREQKPTKIEDVSEYGAEENIWAEQGGSNRRPQKIKEQQTS